MKLSLCRTVRNPRAIPHWVEGQFKRLAGIPNLLPLEEMAEMAQPVWQLPRGVRAAAVVLSLAGLVLGVRVLDAQIADSAPPATFGPVAATLPPEAPSSRTLDEAQGSVVEGSTSLLEAPVGRGEGSGSATAALVPASPLNGNAHSFDLVEVSAYTSSASQTDASPHVTASSRPPRPGTIALSRDLLSRFTPGAPFDFGDRVLVPGMGIYVVEDTMHPRWKKKADIWFESRGAALRWGVRSVYLARIEAGEPVLVPDGF